MTSKSPMRSCEDVDETALSYAEIKALCAGNPLIAEKMNLDVDVAKLRLLKADYQSQHYRLEDDLLTHYPRQITAVEERIVGIGKDMELYNQQKEKLNSVQTHETGAATVTAPFPGMTINGVEYTEKEPAAKALLESCKGIKKDTDVPIGSYMGFNMSLTFDSFGQGIKLHLRGAMTYETALGTDAFGNITRINNTLAGMPDRLENVKSHLERLHEQQEAAKEELKKPFALVDELAEKEARLALLNSELNIDGDGGLEVDNEPENYSDMEDIEESAKSTRSPLAEQIKRYKPMNPEGISEKNRAESPHRKSGEQNI